MNPRLQLMLPVMCFISTAHVAAQRLPAEFSRFRPELPLLQHPDSAAAPVPVRVKDYTMEGAAIGGLAFGVFGAYFGAGMCDMDGGGGRGCTLAALTGFLSGASVGATIGGIIGSAKKKIRPEPADTSLFPRAPSRGGNGAALGAVMVGGGVAVLSTMGCSLDQSGGHEDCAWKAVKRGMIGAVIGGLTGALVGAVLSPAPSPRRGPQ